MLRQHIYTDKNILIATAFASVVAILLPIWIDAIGIFGSYLYQTEYLFCSVLWMHLAIAYFVRYVSIKNIGKVLTNKWFLGIISGCIVFLGLISVWDSFGIVFDFVSNPLVYFVLSFVPAIMLGIAYEVTPKLIERPKAK